MIETYSKEKGIYTSDIKEALREDQVEVDGMIKEKQSDRKQKRIEELKNEKKRVRDLQKEMRPLSSKNHIQVGLRNKFVNCLGSNEEFQSLISLKPLAWKKNILRIVMGSDGKVGDELRRMWVQFYKGDLVFGVMSLRKEAEENGWPNNRSHPSVRDRNAWICFYLRNSCLQLKDKKPVKSKNSI